MRPIACLLLGAGIFVLASPSAAAGERINDHQLKFELTIPDGFAYLPAAVKGDVVHAYQKPPREGRFGTFILISRMKGVLGRDEVDPGAFAKPGQEASVSKERWKLAGLDVDVFRVPEAAGEFEILTFNIQVPLVPEAIQISVSGERADEQELKRIVTALMSNLTGRSNWLTPGERVGRLIKGLLQFSCCCILPLVVIVTTVFASRRKSRTYRKRRRPRYRDDDDDRDRPDREDEDDRDRRT